MKADPLTVACTWCGAEAGERCMALCSWARKPHARRVRLALVLAAHADPALDAVLPAGGPCGLCGTPGLTQRHRVVDAVAGALAAGDDAETLAEDYGLSLEAVRVIEAWAKRWPGAWS